MPEPDVRVLIIATDPLARAGLATLLAGQPGCAVVGQTALQDSFAELLPLYQPEVVLWDLGWDATPTLERLADVRDARIPFVILLPDSAHAAEAWQAGARGLLPRDVDAATLASAIAAAGHGLAALDPTLAAAVASGTAPAPSENGATPPVGDLTPREVDVLRLMAEGLPNKAIAGQLGITEHTVKFHVNAILSKLGAQSRTEAVTKASRLGLILL